MGDSNIFTFTICQLTALLIPPAHYLSQDAAHQSPTSPKNLTPRPSNHANARQRQDHRLSCDQHVTWPQAPHQPVVPSLIPQPVGWSVHFPSNEIVCVSKFSIASARSTVTRTSTTPLAKRPSRHLPHNPLPPKWTLPSELRCWNAAPRGIARSDMLRTGFPSSSSRSPAFSAAPVRSHHVEKKEGICDKGKDVNGYVQAPAVA